jgi:transcription-repair coupling factor (superfamily II helicase)
MFLNKRHLCLSKKTFRFSFTLSFFIKKVSKIRRFKISDFRRPTRKILRKNLKWISRVIFKSKYRSKYRSKYNPKELPQKKKTFLNIETKKSTKLPFDYKSLLFKPIQTLFKKAFI